MTLRTRLAALRNVSSAAPIMPPAPPPASTNPTPSLAERVARMANRAKTKSVNDRELADALEGMLLEPGLIRIDRSIPLSARIGCISPDSISAAPLFLLTNGEAPDPERLVFLDTETSGLAGGSGTVVFLLALARIANAHLEISQWLLTAFRGEAAMLEAAREWIGHAPTLMTFNGKTFDVPLLATRCRMHRLHDPFTRLAHIDLLHPLRRAYAGRWSECKLQSAEQRLLHFHRDNDLPSALMPQAWLEFLRSRSSAPMAAVLEHNRRDVASLPALAATLAHMHAAPDASECDAPAIARWHHARGRKSLAFEMLRDQEALLDDDGRTLLAQLAWQQRDQSLSLRLWQALAANEHAGALERLAIHHEHRLKDYEGALYYAARLLEADPRTRTARRVARLRAKLARSGGTLFAVS
jgi:uncharacterized protein YprB with RNaseH-like and TPR domain